MIRVRHSSGNDFNKREENILYATVWNSALSTPGSMRFYDGDLDFVADFSLSNVADEIYMTSYPHNKKSELLSRAEHLEAEIREALVKISPSPVCVTIDLTEYRVKVLTRELFTRFVASASPKTELFMFDNPDPTKGFPRLYIHEAGNGSDVYTSVFPLLSRMSRFVFPPVNSPTSEGIRFTYILTNSFLFGKFIPDTPNTTGIKFPTKLNCEIPENLDTSALEEFLIKAGVDKVIMKDGKVVDEVEDIDDSDLEISEEDDDFDKFPFGLPSEDSQFINTKSRIVKQIEEQNSFNLGDAIIIGLDWVLAATPISDKIVECVLDFPGIVSKMCIYQGIFHVIPLMSDLQKATEMLDVDEGLIKECTWDNFPKNKPLLPAPPDVI